MRAITLHRPWAQAIVDGVKDTENRVWPIWERLIGKRIAIHAGKKYDRDGALWMLDSGLYVPPSQAEAATGIVGVAVVSHVVADHPSPWFFGPFGWVLSDVQALHEPIAIRGAQGLWKVPDEVVLEIDRQLEPKREEW